MAIKFEKIQPGCRFYRKERARPPRRGYDWVPVLVKEVDSSGRKVYASANNNPWRWVDEHNATKWYSAESYKKAKAKRSAS